jgi:hypothetical protein
MHRRQKNLHLSGECEFVAYVASVYHTNTRLVIAWK